MANIEPCYHCLCMGADCRSHILSSRAHEQDLCHPQHQDNMTSRHHDIKTSWHQDIMTPRHHALSLSNCTNAPFPQCTSGYQYQYKQVRKTPSLFLSRSSSLPILYLKIIMLLITKWSDDQHHQHHDHPDHHGGHPLMISIMIITLIFMLITRWVTPHDDQHHHHPDHHADQRVGEHPLMISIIRITLIFTLINRWVTPRPHQTWSNSARTAIFTRETSTQPGGKNGD